LILGNKHNFLIDTGLGSLSVEPVQEVLNNSLKPLVVINSHYHWDHVWGNGVFKGSTIISHNLCREILEQKWEKMLEENGRYIFGTIEKELPNLTFQNELYFPEDKIKIFFTPGHTADSISVLDEQEKILNVGDNIGDNLDEIVPGLECEKDIYLNTLNIYKSIDFDTCVSSHNRLLGKDVIDLILSKL
jgi:glyoxylase-like metal-dependent hydrolase (beta-lactamase superfamily II)